MTIWLPAGLPAEAVLRAEGVAVNGGSGPAKRPPLRIAVLNLMPRKSVTETQFARLLAATGRDVDLTLFVPDGYRSRTTPDAHLAAFYRRWREIAGQRFDGLIVTGAPVELRDFVDVTYWAQLGEVCAWAREAVQSTLYVCWAAQAALQHFHGVDKSALPRKLSGIYRQRVVARGHPLMADFGDAFDCPVSRNTEVAWTALPQCAGIEVLAESAQSGLCLLEDAANRALYMFNHLEYDATTLHDEFERDREAGLDPDPPRDYYPGDDPRATPVNSWSGAARRLFANWVRHIDVERQRTAMVGEVQDWFTAAGRRVRGDDAPHTDLFICSTVNPVVTAAVFARLAERGDRPTMFRAATIEGGRAFMALRTAGESEYEAERRARAVLTVDGVRRVTYRTSAGAGGCLVATRPPAPAAPPAAPAEDRPLHPVPRRVA